MDIWDAVTNGVTIDIISESNEKMSSNEGFFQIHNLLYRQTNPQRAHASVDDVVPAGAHKATCPQVGEWELLEDKHLHHEGQMVEQRSKCSRILAFP
uniref:Integrase catalytic domain-containing protein n=1 Tax=Steinernema glaseri TaxID=37863 RepID=A0A1I7YT77_9BILA